MFVLAVDTATPIVTAGVVRVDPDGSLVTVAERRIDSPRGHAEMLTPLILECLTEAGLAPDALDAVVVGAGPGPFTGLRVGMATAAAFADALGIPVHGVCSLDALAADVPADPDRELLVVTDARRREVYWARYRAGVRLEGPDVRAPGDVPVDGATRVAGSPTHAALFALPVEDAVAPSSAGLVSVAFPELGSAPAPLVPLYLRRPDAVESAQRRAGGAESAQRRAGGAESAQRRAGTRA